MPSRRTPWILLTVCLALLFAVSWHVSRLVQRIDALQHETASLSKARDRAEAAAKRETEKIARLTQAIATAAPANEAGYDDALDQWLGKVRKLTAYLARHPEKHIPQMEKLTDADWLDATKGRELATEADFRQALGYLRMLAREKYATDIFQALKAAMAHHGGQPPSDVHDLAEYLPADFDRTLLDELELNPSGQLAGFKGMAVYLQDKRVDDLWDGTVFYGPKGYGTHGAFARGESELKGAIGRYTAGTGQPPSDVSQIAADKALSKVQPEQLQELFRAMTTAAQP